MPPLAEALIRHVPEDFRVEEIPAYAAAGDGEHLFVTFRKTGLTTLEAVRRIARALGADARAAGFAGMKDRHAITTQTASFQLPLDRDPALEEPIEGIEVLSWERHRHKLKTGHLRGNRFTIRLRRLSLDARDGIDEALALIAARGVPNAFGAQRFGRGGDNAELALRWLRGEARPPRGKKERRLLFSALQSHLFNLVLARREADETWCTVLAGDIAQKRDTGGLFDVEESERDEARARAERGEISATGPMFGARMRRPHGAVDELERQVLVDAGIGDTLDAHRALGEGTRRALRLWVDELEWQWSAEEPYLTVRFVLPKGGYATTVLSRAFLLVDPHTNP